MFSKKCQFYKCLSPSTQKVTLRKGSVSRVVVGELAICPEWPSVLPIPRGPGERLGSGQPQHAAVITAPSERCSGRARGHAGQAPPKGKALRLGEAEDLALATQPATDRAGFQIQVP